MNQQSFRSVFRIFAALVLAACLCLPAFADSGDTPESLILQTVSFYAGNGRRNKKALRELAELDPVRAEKWERIMDLWETPVKVNSRLPDGLPDDDTLCLVVLGYQLNPDGTMRMELVERLRVALAASRKYPNALIVCTGGPTAWSNPEATEAEKMAEWLIRNGVSPDRIVTENRSLTTAENTVFTFDILEERFPRVTRLAIISSDYHVPSGVLLFGAEAILRDLPVTVVSNAGWRATEGSQSMSVQGFALLQLSIDR